MWQQHELTRLQGLGGRPAGEYKWTMNSTVYTLIYTAAFTTTGYEIAAAAHRVDCRT